MRCYTVKMAASFENAVALVTTALDQRGFNVVRSFDLAGTLDPNDPNCSCPHHGTEKCTCRYTVLLVYRRTQESSPGDFAPHSITVHVRDGEAYIGLSRLEPVSEPLSKPDTQEEAVVQALVDASLSLLQDAAS